MKRAVSNKHIEIRAAVRNWQCIRSHVIQQMSVRLRLGAILLLPLLSGCYTHTSQTATIVVGNHTILPELSSKTGEFHFKILNTIDGLYISFPATSNNSAYISLSYTNTSHSSYLIDSFSSSNNKSLSTKLTHNPFHDGSIPPSGKSKIRPSGSPLVPTEVHSEKTPASEVLPVPQNAQTPESIMTPH